MRYIAATYIIILIAAFSVSPPVMGQDTRDAELQQADNELNSVYKTLLRQLASNSRANLQVAQRAWIKMRDADCRWAFVDKRDCLIDRTINRTHELKETWFQTITGEYKSLGE